MSRQQQITKQRSKRRESPIEPDVTCPVRVPRESLARVDAVLEEVEERLEEYDSDSR